MAPRRHAGERQAFGVSAQANAQYKFHGKHGKERIFKGSSVKLSVVRVLRVLKSLRETVSERDARGMGAVPACPLPVAGMAGASWPAPDLVIPFRLLPQLSRHLDVPEMKRGVFQRM